jgi:uncharacterized membrane protein YhaH (DUF805 family)
MKIQDLFTFQGRVGRSAYILTGIIGTLMRCKYTAKDGN